MTTRTPTTTTGTNNVNNEGYHDKNDNNNKIILKKTTATRPSLQLDPTADGPFPGCDRDMIDITDAV